MRRPDHLDQDRLLTVASSSPDAFARFYRLFEQPILGFFVRATRDPELAADLAAETFANALESVTLYDPAKGRADQWLFGIARNVLGKSYRRGRVEAAARERLAMPKLVLDDHALATIARLGSRTEAIHALASLPTAQRDAVEAHVLEERDYTEIARELRCSEAVVRKRVSRGLRALRTRLAGEQ
jgi:RNA polymerase sigma-70 factor, ECF subfamily